MIEVFIDGASAGNPGPSGAGVFIKTQSDVHRFSFPLPHMTNHEAEYHALIKALEVCIDKGFKTVSCKTDSLLVEKAVDTRYVKNKLYAPLLEEAVQLIDQLDLFFIKWIPEKQNKTADVLARQAIVRS
ncbi:reverse transcriptase-like protein [Priestia endophytica]|jgi:ribonuclease HI|uniref:Ribonuclease HI n=1 Tax=Priestia endophytica DSM 13796 TaxID=1121089 RepID=A0A1I5Y5P1_9BACI|nr:reverse transcriptase-like protein [Priestia endophytica]KYG31566.1 ribonuclease H [Priestia endophytica]MBG9811569.1 ribonuclease H [Priestia endophytica]MCM3537008.1 reverse transcriptase-like protein [Priestia endophytica]RAS74205.1 ribonuclease HI [Priestia endophytica]RAS84907.1 ribonuclease HI [Priestia endophytica]